MDYNKKIDSLIQDNELYSVEINKSILSNKQEAFDVIKDIDSNISCDVQSHAVEDLDHELDKLKSENKDLQNGNVRLSNELKNVHEEYNCEIKNRNNLEKENIWVKDKDLFNKNENVRNNKE